MLILFERMFNMRKFKKTLSAIAAAVMCTVPMINGITAGAYQTFRIYHEVNDRSVAYFDFTINYSSNVIAEPSMKTNLCEKGNFNSINYNLSRKIQTNYNGAAIGQTGTAATTKLLVSIPVTSIFDEISYTMPIVKNASGATLNPFLVTHDYVLVGDSNNDGEINLADAIYIQQFLANTNKYSSLDERAADADGDGIVTTQDAKIIQNYVLGIITHF